VTARKAPFRTRRGHTPDEAGADFSTNTSSIAGSKESFHRGCARVASLPPKYRGRNAKKKLNGKQTLTGGVV
jgi:hypothetical protein